MRIRKSLRCVFGIHRWQFLHGRIVGLGLIDVHVCERCGKVRIA